MILSMDILTLLAPAFCAGVIISLVHVPLGQEVLKRGIIFLDLAVAQFAALGMIAFKVFVRVDEYSYIGIYGGLFTGLVTALLCAFSFQYLEKYSGRYQEALIGCAFVLSASLSLLIVGSSPDGGENIKNILEGQILWTDWSDLKLIVPVFLVAFLAWNFLKEKRSILFYPLFAVVIPFSVNLIGVYLVFASLIFPALAVVKSRNYNLIKGLAISVVAYIFGLGASYIFDWPSGPALVVAFAIIASFYAFTTLMNMHRVSLSQQPE